MHPIKPGQIHALVEIRLAIDSNISQDPELLTDGVYSMLNRAVHQDCVADFEFDMALTPAKVKASDWPAQGELFDARQFMLCVQDSDYQEHWYHITSAKPLDTMAEDELATAVSDVVHIGSDDRVYITDVRAPQRLQV